MALDNNRRLRQHRLDAQGLYPRAIDEGRDWCQSGTIAVGAAGHSVAEIIFATGIEPQIFAHLGAPRFEETDEPANMIVMTVAQDQRVDGGSGRFSKNRGCWRRRLE